MAVPASARSPMGGSTADGTVKGWASLDEREDLADENQGSGDVNQAEAVERGEVGEVLGVEGGQW
jgi:hypothetical protein